MIKGERNEKLELTSVEQFLIKNGRSERDSRTGVEGLQKGDP